MLLEHLTSSHNARDQLNSLWAPSAGKGAPFRFVSATQTNSIQHLSTDLEPTKMLMDTRHMALGELTQNVKIKAIVWAAEILGGAQFWDKKPGPTGSAPLH